MIKEAEVKLSAVRQAQTEQGEEIAYQITGVVDVLAAARFTSDTDNPLVAYVMKRLDGLANSDEELEVILDYKGIARGEVDDAGEMASRQILTYSWLRNRRLQKKGSTDVSVGHVTVTRPGRGGQSPPSFSIAREINA